MTMNKKTLYQSSLAVVDVGIILYFILEYGFEADDALVQSISTAVIALAGMWLFAWWWNR
ncbi:MAG: hypothetical protein WAN34_06565 [Acidimicrobiia bacterium]